MIKLFLMSGFTLAVIYGVLLTQLVILSRIFKSRSWKLLACGFLIYSGRAFWSFVSIPDQLVKGYTRSLSQGAATVAVEDMLSQLMTFEVWTLLITAFIAPLFLIAAMEYQRRDLRSFGVDVAKP